MIEKVRKKLTFICFAILAGVAGVQLMYAVFWAVRNGNNVQDFYDTAIYLRGAVELQSDGWRLIGYSCFLRTFLWMIQGLGEYYVVLIYLVQCIISLLCFAEGIRGVIRLLTGCSLSYRKALLPAGYILTIPVIWQMQFAILPDALCLSLLVLLEAYLIGVFNEKERFYFFRILVVIGVLLFLGITHRHYFYGALVMVSLHVLIMVVCMLLKKEKRKKLFVSIIVLLVSLFLSPILCTTANRESVQNGEYATYSLEADLWKRFVYPYVYDNYEAYAEDVTLAISEEDALYCEEYYEYYMQYLGPKLEAYNPENAKGLYSKMVYSGITCQKNDLLKSSVKEMIAYFLMPFSMEKYMHNNNDSLYGHNVIKMYEMAPEVTLDYIHAGMNGLVPVVICGGLASICICFQNKERRGRFAMTSIYLAIILIGVTFPMMLFSFAKFDYRIGLFSVFLWSAVSLSAILSLGIFPKDYLSEGRRDEQ